MGEGRRRRRGARARGAGAARRADRATTRRSTTSTQPIRDKIETIVKRVYGGDGVDYSPAAARAIDYLESIGLHHTPVCMAKTQYSLTDDPSRLGRPTGFRITVNEVYGSAGAGFVVAKTGDIMTMPGLPKVPAAEGMAVKANGEIVGLS